MLGEYAGLFLLGITTFLSPCSIALISVYLTYATGMSKNIRKGFVVGCQLALAMCLVFFFLGYAVSSLIPINAANYRLFLAFQGLFLFFLELTIWVYLKKFVIQNLVL